MYYQLKNIKLIAAIVGWLCMSTSIFADETKSSFVVKLWDDDASFIHVFLPSPLTQSASGSRAKAVIICPGGGYSGLSMNHEGYDWAPFFNEQGMAAVVLKYRMPAGDLTLPVSDALEAMRQIKAHAAEWGIHPDSIGIMGSSAGGHLASTIATHAPTELRPAFQILFYPVITMNPQETHRGSHDNFLGKKPRKDKEREYSNELQVDDNTPPAFITLSDDDKAVIPANSIKYYNALQAHNIPASLHIYPSGGHGWGIRESFKYHDAMMMELKKWITETVAAKPIDKPSANVLPPVFGAEYANITQKDVLTRFFIAPQRIVWKQATVSNEEILLLPGNSQAEMTRRNLCLMTSSETDTASLLLDYGKELHGGLQLVMGSSSQHEPSLVRIRFGETVGECNSQTSNSGGKVGYATDDHAKRDIIMEIPRDGLIEIGNTGFRFVRIDLLQRNTTIRLREARAILRIRDIPYLGSFNSDDKRLNQIWLTGAYTVHLNMQEYLWDGIKRDRLVWLGDMHPEVSTILSVFGANDVVPLSLDLACEQFPLPAWMNGIFTYSLWYLIIHHDWYMQNGDLDFLKKHRKYILGLIDRLDKVVTDSGEFDMQPFYFLDWPSSPNEEGVRAGCRALTVWAMREAGKLCAFLDEPTYTDKTNDIIRRLNITTKGHNNLKQAASLMVIADILDPQKACNDVVSVGGAKGFSTFYGYYMLQAQARAGQYRMALDIIRQYWGGMLDMGATTFWEDFDLSWTENAARLDEPTPPDKKDIHGDFGAYCYPGYRHSFCHGWASGPTAWMSEYILGIKILEPGCKTIQIDPHLGDLQWVEGTYPTPFGILKVKHTQDSNGRITSEINAPAGIKIIKKQN